MTSVTLALAIISSILIIRTRSITGLLVYSASLLWYPQYLTIPIATIDFNLSRVAVLVLFFVCILRDRKHREYRWSLMDTLMIIYIIFRLISISQNELFNVFIIRESGGLVDTVVIYWLVRVIIRTREDLLHFFKGLVIISVPIAILGMYQSMTGYNVYAFATQFNRWMEMSQHYLVRHGFYRGDVSFGNYIAYGMYFAALVPISICVFDRRHKILSILLIMFMTGGVLSSMSSGPYFSLGISILTIILFSFRSYLKVIVITIIISICFLEFYSNRSWYEALTRFAFSSETAYYRVALIEEAMHGGMSGNWLTGYGYVGIDEPYNSLGKYWGWENQDMTNIYILTLVKYGLLGLIPYLFINILYYRRLFMGYRYLKRNDSWIIWCFFSAIFGWNVAMQTVAPLAQVGNILYIYIALCVNIPDLFHHKEIIT